MINPLTVIEYYYPEDTPLRRMLLKHSAQVRDKALEILKNPVCDKFGLDPEFVSAGAMLHDIGISECHAPDILCIGRKPYLAHGITGAEMLREYGKNHDLDLEAFARICERHTGTGITAEEIRKGGLPLPERDLVPETAAEKLICLADKFYSKSGDMQEKDIKRVRRSMEKFGLNTVQRFDDLCRMFGYF